MTTCASGGMAQGRRCDTGAHPRAWLPHRRPWPGRRWRLAAIAAAAFGPAAFVIVALAAVYRIFERAPSAPAASGDGAAGEVSQSK